MGWGHCGHDDDDRPIGYAITATCDEPGCSAKIDRGLAYACGGMHGGGKHGCGRYFCPAHLVVGGASEQLCAACLKAYDEAHPNENE